MFQINGRQRFTIHDALRPRGEFVPEAWYSENESGRLRVRLYLAAQPGDEHVDVAIVEFRAMPDNGTTQLVARQHPATTAYECRQHCSLGAGQLYFPAVAIDKGV